MLKYALTLALCLLSNVRAQGDLSAANNVTDLEGTWSSNPSVQTGRDFCVPAEMRFTYPNNTGISYSFTNTGYFEEAQYRYNSNASNPACIQATIFWQHGTYRLNNNGSITMYPFGPDGRIQVQDPCAAVTNIITYYNQQTIYADWGITVDITSGRYVLKMNRFDGAKMPYMYLQAKPPNMMPTQILTGTNASGQTVTRRRNVADLFKRSSAPARAYIGSDVGALAGLLGLAVSAAGLGLGML
ncbi:chaperone for protein-folding within the ER, fungal-domain-containing protein [Dioszegia hungarica]|uniref:Protein ROT1 n=1 Tax=Dioszegia hungarica TaxID=4972 RepID=A0AA38H4E0_9TREE|nr:chaperone for protein-folding within the ER, fungal-domain-containing protein [Dioszegia hungarica]KAI9633938.1 chaperone for protein-folding within the ER, fungal-domain-containing protein [Dioszegia hungarica]